MSEIKAIRAWWLQVVYFGIFATLLALVEIMIEGPEGWSAGLKYNWVPRQEGWYMDIWAVFMGGDKVFDGYHLFMILFLLVVFHMPFVAPLYGRAKWTGRAEIQILTVFSLIGVLWDFLWFVWNPWYGMSRFDAAHVGWHKEWWGPVPAGYFMAIMATIAIILVYGLYVGWRRGEWVTLKAELARHFATISAFLFFALISIGAAALFVTPR